jgi:hypothetical protein
MGRPRKWHLLTAANARTAKQRKNAVPLASSIEVTIENLETELLAATGSDSEVIEVTKWTGGVNHDPETDNSDFSWDDTEVNESTDESDNEYEEMACLERAIQHELQLLYEPTPYDQIMKKHSAAEWKEGEKNRGFGYTGNSDRTTRRRDQLARNKAKSDVKLQKS